MVAEKCDSDSDDEKKVPGMCGCRVVNSESDECPNDIDKKVPGLWGCGEVDAYGL